MKEAQGFLPEIWKNEGLEVRQHKSQLQRGRKIIARIFNRFLLLVHAPLSQILTKPSGVITSLLL